MQHNHDRTPIEAAGQEPGDRPRSLPRVRPRLEILETRCLMSGMSEGDSLLAGLTPADGSPPADVRTAAGREEVSHASYVIVDETGAAHDTPGSAQVLPDVPFFGVIGALAADDSIDLYSLPLSGGSSSVEFELFSLQPPPAIPLHFLLLSSSGQVLGQWNSAEVGGSQYLDIDLAGLPGGSSVWLGVTSAGSSPAGAVPYQLWVTRQVTTDQPATGQASPGSPPAATTIASPFAPPSNPNLAANSVARSAGAPITGGSVSDIRGSVGSLPARSAGPLGGRMVSPGDPTPPARSSGITLNPDSAEPGPGAHREGGVKVLVTLRGPGGSPVIGAAAIGNRGRDPHDLAAASDEALSQMELDDPSEPASSLLDDSSPASTELATAATVLTPGLRSPRGVGASISSGLGLAMALTLNAVFSDPAAGFDSLATRLDHGSGRRAGRPRSRPGVNDPDGDRESAE